MEWWIELQKIISLEWLMVIYTAFPIVGKGILSIATGICEFQFSFWKVVFLCSIGTAIKAGFYFPIIYGTENYLHRKDIWVWRKIKAWVYGKIKKAKNDHNIFLSFLDFQNLGPGRSFFWTMVIVESLIFVSGTGCLKKILILLPALILLYFSYKNRNKTWIVYLSLLIIPNIGLGILSGACLAYFYKVRFWKGFLTVIFGSVVSTIILTLGMIFYKAEVMIVIFKIKDFLSS